MSAAACDSAPERVRVLLVDDTTEIRMLLRIVLESDGRFEIVGEASDGLEAVQVAGEVQPDVVVLDLAMPRVDGLQALPDIRRSSPAARVVVLSAFPSAQIEADARTAGADAYLEKGTAADDLVATIATLVGAQRVRTAGPPNPQPLGAVGAAVDLDELLAHLNHELRTPVTVLQGFAATLRVAVERGDTDTVIRCADAIHRNVQNLDNLVGSFADARAVDVGRIELDVEPVDLAALVGEAAADLEDVLDHPVRVVLPAPSLVVPADRARVRQVLVNLLSNAAKFSPPGRAVEVRLRVVDGTACIDVVDDGGGIPAGRSHELFRKFGRLHSGVRGTGLGLYISRGIARAHGGDIDAADEPGRGACFTLRLPVSPRSV